MLHCPERFPSSRCNRKLGCAKSLGLTASCSAVNSRRIRGTWPGFRPRVSPVSANRRSPLCAILIRADCNAMRYMMQAVSIEFEWPILPVLPVAPPGYPSAVSRSYCRISVSPLIRGKARPAGNGASHCPGAQRGHGPGEARPSGAGVARPRSVAAVRNTASISCRLRLALTRPARSDATI